MGPGDRISPTNLDPPSYAKAADKLQWRKAVRYWCQSIAACAKGGDARSKGVIAAFGLLLFRSLPPGKQQLVEKSINSGELVIDRCDESSPQDQSTVVESIIKIVAKDSATDSIRRMAALNKQASSCVRRDSESISEFVERFTLPAQAYLNITNSDRSSGESQNFAMMLISNAKLPPPTFTSVMNNLVQASKCTIDSPDGVVPLSSARLDKLLSLLDSLSNGTETQSLFSEVKTNQGVLMSAKKRLAIQKADSGLTSYISLSDAIASLEDVSFSAGDLDGGKRAKVTEDPFIGAADKISQALLAHTAYARKFNNSRQDDGFNPNGHNRRRPAGEDTPDNYREGSHNNRPRKFTRRPENNHHDNNRNRQGGAEASKKGRFFQ